MAPLRKFVTGNRSETPSPETALPPVIDAHEVSLGVMRKPPGCKRCAYRTVGEGFCPDYLPAHPKVAIMLEAPGGDEIQENEPLRGRAGQLWYSKLILPAGLEREDCLIANTLRCRPPENKYPTGRVRKHAEELCRQYDDSHGKGWSLVAGGLRSFNPNAFVVAMHPAALLRSSAAMRLVKKAVERTAWLARVGYRPCLLMGDKPMSIVAPFLTGGVKRWNGHYWLGTWPFGGKKPEDDGTILFT